MHLPLFRTILMVFVIFLTTCSFALADAELIYIDHMGQQQRQSMMQIKDGKIRMETAETGHYSIYDSQKELLYNVNTQLEQYIENSPALIKERANRVRQWRQKLLAYWQSQLSNLSPSQRSLLEQRIQALKMLLEKEQIALKTFSNTETPKLQYQTTDEKRQIQGFSCDVVHLLYAQKPYREICLAQETDISKEDLKTLNQLFVFMQNMSETAQHFTQDTTDKSSQAPAFFPVMDGLMITLKDLNIGTKRELITLAIKPLPARLFNLPPHYTLVSPLPEDKR